MIYLFNSAYRPLYTQNVLNTLFIPKGGTNEYRYRVRGHVTHIAADSYGNFINAASGEPIAVIFIDRFGNGRYVYHPLRTGRLVKCREKEDRLYFRVHLDEFVYPQKIDRFNQVIKKTLGSMGLPCLTGDDPREADDGYYAIEAGSLFTAVNDFHWGEDAWTNAVEQLRKTQAFSDTQSSVVDVQQGNLPPTEFLFVRCEICDQSTKRQRVAPKLRKDLAVFDLLRGTRYEFLVSYRYPAQLADTSCTAMIQAKFGENLRALGSTTINVNSYSNSVPLPFATKRHLEDNQDGVSFELTSSRSKFKLIGPDANLLFSFSESKRFWITLVILLLAFTTLSVFIGADLDKMSPPTVGNVAKLLWSKALAGFLQAMVLFFLFRLMGKKFL